MMFQSGTSSPAVRDSALMLTGIQSLSTSVANTMLSRVTKSSPDFELISSQSVHILVSTTIRIVS